MDHEKSSSNNAGEGIYFILFLTMKHILSFGCFDVHYKVSPKR
jgi:hypothetical protein